MGYTSIGIKNAAKRAAKKKAVPNYAQPLEIEEKVAFATIAAATGYSMVKGDDLLKKRKKKPPMPPEKRAENNPYYNRMGKSKFRGP